MQAVRVLFILTVVLALTACAVTYRYGDKSFTDPKEAEAAQKADIEKVREAIKPLNVPLAKVGRIVIPSRNLVAEKNANKIAPEYLTAAAYNSNRSIVEFIKKRNIFETATVEESPISVTQLMPKTGEKIVYLSMPENKPATWHYVSEKTKPTPIYGDWGNPDKVARVTYFLSSLENLVTAEK